MVLGWCVKTFVVWQQTGQCFVQIDVNFAAIKCSDSRVIGVVKNLLKTKNVGRSGLRFYKLVQLFFTMSPQVFKDISFMVLFYLVVFGESSKGDVIYFTLVCPSTHYLRSNSILYSKYERKS